MHANHSTRSLLLALLVTGTLLGCSPEEQFTEVSQELNSDDYMSRELRTRVEALKSAVATEATSETAEEKNKKTKCGIWEILIIVFLSAIVFVSVVLAIDIGNTTVR